MAESALTDQSPAVRAAAARALGPMGAVSSVPKLKAVLNDKEPAVVLAAARSLFLLGDRKEVYGSNSNLKGEKLALSDRIDSHFMFEETLRSNTPIPRSWYYGTRGTPSSARSLHYATS